MVHLLIWYIHTCVCSMPRCRHVVFTAYGTTTLAIKERLDAWPGTRFACFQLERCPRTNREHVQGYLCANKPCSFPTFKHVLGLDVHLERMRGTSAECVAYCTKTETRISDPVTIGLLPDPDGRRSAVPLQDAMCAVRSGKSELHISMKYPTVWAVYRTRLLEFASLLRPERSWKTKLYVYWGPTGTGKTWLAHKLAPRAYIHTNTPWFDGYVGQDAAIFDDFNEEVIARDAFLRLFDRYPMSVPIKGGFVQWTPRRCFITTNYNPDRFYSGCPAVARRIDGTFGFENVWRLSSP